MTSWFVFFYSRSKGVKQTSSGCAFANRILVISEQHKLSSDLGVYLPAYSSLGSEIKEYGKGVKYMDDKKKDAYLHLMYKAFVEVRLYSAMYYQIKSIWWNPFRWVKFYTYLRQINRLADAFHNLPIYLKSDNTDFNEDSFWRYLEAYEKQYVTYEKESYRSIFNKMVS